MCSVDLVRTQKLNQHDKYANNIYIHHGEATKHTQPSDC